MENNARDEDSQDIYLEVAILITDASPTAREMLLQVKREESWKDEMAREVLFNGRKYEGRLIGKSV